MADLQSGNPPDKPPGDRPPRDGAEGGDDDNEPPWSERNFLRRRDELSLAALSAREAMEQRRPLSEEPYVLLTDLMDRENDSRVTWLVPPDMTNLSST